MKSAKVTLWALALFVLLFVIFISAGYYDHLTRQSREAMEESTLLLADIRRLQMTTNQLRMDSGALSVRCAGWDESRAGFMARFARIQSQLTFTGEMNDRVRRLGETIASAESVQRDLRADLEQVRGSNLAAQISAIGMMGAYERVLNAPVSRGADIALLGMVTFRLNEYQRGLTVAESDLVFLVTALGQQTTAQHRSMRIAVVSAFVVALFAASVMLRRITRLHMRVVHDHGEKEIAEARLRSSEADLRCMLDSIADAVIATDEGGLITRMNPVASKLTGWSASEAIGQPLSRVFVAVSESTGAPMSNPAEHAGESEGALLWDGNARLSSREGDERVVIIGASLINGSQSRHGGVVVVFKDITEQRRAELRIRNDQRSDSVAKLASGVAHEINNVLQIVRANLAFAQDPRSTAAESAECLGMIDQATRRAAELTRKLLIFSRKHPMRLAEGSLSRFFDSLLPALRKQVGEKIEIEYLGAESIPMVRIDQRLLELAFSSLCENAREAMASGGKLSIELSTISFSQEEVDAYTWARPGTFVQISVSDTGCGMDADTLKRIFEPFFTTKSLAVSTGMGLSVVQGIIQQHEGFIHAFSEIGRGSTFRIFIPTAQQDVVRKGMSLPDGAPKASRGKQILFADDDSPLRGLVASLLRRQGYDVRIAGDGEDACAIAIEGKLKLDLLILDVVMPRLGGVDAARRILQCQPHVPVILFTGHGRNPLESNPAVDPMWRVLRKPLVPVELIKAVDELTNKAN